MSRRYKLLLSVPMPLGRLTVMPTSSNLMLTINALRNSVGAGTMRYLTLTGPACIFRRAHNLSL